MGVPCPVCSGKEQKFDLTIDFGQKARMWCAIYAHRKYGCYSVIFGHEKGPFLDEALIIKLARIKLYEDPNLTFLSGLSPAHSCDEL
jgi:hypothetical protein